MQTRLRALAAGLRSPAPPGLYVHLSLLLTSLLVVSCCFSSFARAAARLRPHDSAAPGGAFRPEALLDNFTCAPGAAGPGDVEDGPPFSPTAEGNESPQSWEPQVPCVESRSVNVFVQHRVEPGNVLLMCDIDDTLIASGGWSWIGEALGGTDDRYARGSDYPGLAAVLYLLGLGPHLRDADTRNLAVFKPPLQIAVVSSRPNMTFFRPDYLLPHLDAILTRGAHQVNNDEELDWKVGTENNMLSPKVLKGLNARGELKVTFGLDAIRRREPLNGSRINAETKFIFVGDSGQRDPEVALALATVEPGALLAVFMNVVRRTSDPHWRQTLRSSSDEEEDFQSVDGVAFRSVPENEDPFSMLAKKLTGIFKGAAAAKKGNAKADGKRKSTIIPPPGSSIEMQVFSSNLPESGEATTRNLAATEDVLQFDETVNSQKDDSQKQQEEGSDRQQDSSEELQQDAEKQRNSEQRLAELTKMLASALARAGEQAVKPSSLFDEEEEDPLAFRALSEDEMSSETRAATEEDAASEAGGAAAEAGAAAAAQPDGPVQRSASRTYKLRNSQRRKIPPRVSISEALANTRRFAIRVGDFLVDAIQVVYDVHLATDDLDGPQTCSALNARQAYAVATKVGQKLRNIWDAYDHRWKHSPDGFNVAAPGIAGLSATREKSRRPLPLVFVKCNSVRPHITSSPESSDWRRFWSFFTETSDRIDVRFIVKDEPIVKQPAASSFEDKRASGTIFVSPEELNKPAIGTPVAPYTTALSAAAHAYVLGFIDLFDVATIVRKTHEALRSQGPLSRSARLPALLDHLYDLEGLKALLFSRGAPESGPVREVADLIDSLLISQYAFAKRAAYVRAFPNRQQECIRDLQRSLLDAGRENTLRNTGRGTTLRTNTGWQFNRGRLVAFGTPFAAFVCEYDLELASLQYAGAAELAGLAVTLSKVVREALMASERAAADRDAPAAMLLSPQSAAASATGKFGGEDAAVGFDMSHPEPSQQHCPLPPEKVQRFKEHYASMCKAFAPIACQLLRTRLSSPVLQDLLVLAESRAANRNGPIELPHFGIVITHDEDVQDYFENLHQRPAAQLLGFLGDPVDYALQPSEETKGYFEKWPTAETIVRWRSIAESILYLLQCNLIS